MLMMHHDIFCPAAANNAIAAALPYFYLSVFSSFLLSAPYFFHRAAATSRRVVSFFVSFRCVTLVDCCVFAALVQVGSPRQLSIRPCVHSTPLIDLLSGWSSIRLCVCSTPLVVGSSGWLSIRPCFCSTPLVVGSSGWLSICPCVRSTPLDHSVDCPSVCVFIPLLCMLPVSVVLVVLGVLLVV